MRLNLILKSYSKGFAQDNKISNIKHQNTNKSQISIFHDQNLQRNCIPLISIQWLPGMIMLVKAIEGLTLRPAARSVDLNFEFGHWNLFGIWFLVLGILDFLMIRSIL